MLRKLSNLLSGKSTSTTKAQSSLLSGYQKQARQRELIKKEAQIGATLFGPIPQGHNRQFFCLDRYTWIWTEEWYDNATKMQKSMRVQYDFQPRGVLKVVDGVATGYVRGQELAYLLKSMYEYRQRVAAEVYGVNLAPITD